MYSSILVLEAVTHNLPRTGQERRERLRPEQNPQEGSEVSLRERQEPQHVELYVALLPLPRATPASAAAAASPHGGRAPPGDGSRSIVVDVFFATDAVWRADENVVALQEVHHHAEQEQPGWRGVGWWVVRVLWIGQVKLRCKTVGRAADKGAVSHQVGCYLKSLNERSIIRKTKKESSARQGLLAPCVASFPSQRRTYATPPPPHSPQSLAGPRSHERRLAATAAAVGPAVAHRVHWRLQQARHHSGTVFAACCSTPRLHSASAPTARVHETVQGRKTINGAVRLSSWKGAFKGCRQGGRRRSSKAESEVRVVPRSPFYGMVRSCACMGGDLVSAHM